MSEATRFEGEVSLRRRALSLLGERCVQAKVCGVGQLDLCSLIGHNDLIEPKEPLPGRPERPRLVNPRGLKARSVSSLEGRAALVHALAHIELNAVDLALDVIWRFHDMPDLFYVQWAGVAMEEATHFALLEKHLESLGYRYGDFDAHNGLWEMAEKTKNDLLARIALVPRILEARGLDASPAVKAKLLAVGDIRAGEILDIILRDEITHVAIGNRWFRWLCEQRGLDARSTFARLAEAHGAPHPRGPINFDARKAAGFTDDELADLAAQTR